MLTDSLKASTVMIWILFFLPAITFGQTILFQETFEDANFASRGWYDSPKGTIDTTQHVPGSNASFQCRFLKGGQGCSRGAPARHAFQATNSVYVGFYIKQSANWVGQSNTCCDAHLFYLLTNQNDAFSGLAFTHLTGYIENDFGYGRVAFQDGQNIDQTKLNVNLVKLTEKRAVMGCNGNSDGYGHMSCYKGGNGTYWNGKYWNTPKAVFTDTKGPHFKGDWHLVEVYMKLNSISNGMAVKDGVIQYWFDGVLMTDIHNAVIRTGQHPTMRFNQFIIGPFMGQGSPVDQTFWVDNLTVATSKP